MSSSAVPPEGQSPPSRPSNGPERLFAWLRSLGLRRDPSDRWVAGVCSGVARRLGVDPLVVRAAVLVLLLFGGLGVALYVLAWVFLPSEDGSIRAEDALRGDASSIALLVFVGLVVAGQMSNRSSPWLLIPLGIVVWLLVRNWRAGAGRSASATAPGTPEQGHVGLATSIGTAASTAPLDSGTSPTGPAGVLPFEPTVPTTPEGMPSSAAHGLGPGRTWAPGPSPVAVLPRQRRPGIGILGVSAVLGLAVLAYGIAETTGATSRPVALGLVCAVGTLGLALLVIGLLGRRGSGLAVLGIGAAAVAALTVALPASLSWSSIGADGIGQTTWRPSSSEASAASLRWGAGSATLDLGAFPASATAPAPASASLGLGELVVVVPAGRTVEVDATVGAGEIVRRTGTREGATTFSRDGTDLKEQVTVGTGPADTRVTAHVGLGSITVVTP